jgi:hypothetical protein
LDRVDFLLYFVAAYLTYNWILNILGLGGVPYYFVSGNTQETLYALPVLFLVLFLCYYAFYWLSSYKARFYRPPRIAGRYSAGDLAADAEAGEALQPNGH